MPVKSFDVKLLLTIPHWIAIMNSGLEWREVHLVSIIYRPSHH